MNLTFDHTKTSIREALGIPEERSNVLFNRAAYLFMTDDLLTISAENAFKNEVKGDKFTENEIFYILFCIIRFYAERKMTERFMKLAIYGQSTPTELLLILFQKNVNSYLEYIREHAEEYSGEKIEISSRNITPKTNNPIEALETLIGLMSGEEGDDEDTEEND